MGFAGLCRFTLPACVLSLLCASSARAQAAFAISVRAAVPGELSLETTDIDFGQITPGQTQVVLPQSTAIAGSAGRVLLTYNGDGVSVSLPGEMTLIGPGAEIQASLRCAATPSREAPQGTPFACADGFIFVPTTTGATNPIVFVGGVVSGSETQGKPAGVYTGAVVVTAQNIST